MLQAILSDCETTTDAINLAVRWKDPVILRTQLEESDAVDPRGLARALTNALLGNEPEVVRALIQYNVTPQHVLLRTLMRHGKGVQSASLEHAWGELYEWTPKSYDDLSAQFGRGSFYRRLGQLMAPKTMKRRVGLHFRAWKLPRTVMWWLIAVVMTGMNIITLATTLALTIHAGNGPPMRWCMPFQL